MAFWNRQPREQRSITSADFAGPHGRLVGGQVWWPQARTLNAGQTNSAILMKCLAIKANSMAALDLGVRDADGQLITDDPICRLFNKAPNPEWNARIFKGWMWWRLERDHTFIYVQRSGMNNDGEPTALWPVTQEVQPVLDDQAPDMMPKLLGYRVGPKRLEVMPQNMLWLRYPGGEDGYDHVSSVALASGAQELDAYARQSQLAEFKNGARPSGIVKLGEGTLEQAEEARQAFKAAATGPENAARVIALQGKDVGFDRWSLTPQEMSYIESRPLNWDEITHATGVPRDIVFGQAKFENYDAAMTSLWSLTLIPQLEVVASEVDRILMPEPERTAEWDTSKVEPLQEQQDAIYNRVKTGSESETLLIDEQRKLLGLGPLANGMGQYTTSVYRAIYAPRALNVPGGTEEPAADTGAPPLAPTPVDEERVDSAPRETRAAFDHAAHNRTIDRHQAALRRSVERLAEKQKRVTLRNLDRFRAKKSAHEVRAIQQSDIFDDDYWKAETIAALEEAVAATWDAGGSRVAADLGLDYDVYVERVVTQMRSRLKELSGQITDTTAEVIRQGLLEAGVEEGESVTQLAERITSVFDDLAGYRAETIARTETMVGFNRAGRDVARASGVVKGRKWLAAADADEECSALDGEETEMDGTYPGGDEPGEVHPNCRCVEEFLLIDGAGDGASDDGE